VREPGECTTLALSQLTTADLARTETAVCWISLKGVTMSAFDITVTSEEG